MIPTGTSHLFLRTDLLLIDDVLPSSFSPFRTLEYSHYLRFFDARLLSLEGWRSWVPGDGFENVIATAPITSAMRHFSGKFSDWKSIEARCAYVTFLNNAYNLVNYFESRGLPFIVQLYPGGGFELHQPKADDKLRRVIGSPLLRRVIVTQNVAAKYLVEDLALPASKIELIYGGVFDSRTAFDFWRDKVRFPADKPTLDICFVGHNYGEVSSKGYDKFIEIARQLSALDLPVNFHVVGGYSTTDIALSDVVERVHFYGVQAPSFFPAFFARMDMIISINAPFALAPGAFDGFPTGSCIEAGLHGTLNCVNDPLGMNECFVDNRDIVLLGSNLEAVVPRLRVLLSEPDVLYELAYNNLRSYRAVFDIDQQLWRRTRTITQELLQNPRRA